MLRLKVKSQFLFGVRVDGSHRKHKAFAFSMMLATIKGLNLRILGLAVLKNDAGLPVLQSMSNKFKAALEKDMKINSPQ